MDYGVYNDKWNGIILLKMEIISGTWLNLILRPAGVHYFLTPSDEEFQNS